MDTPLKYKYLIFSVGLITTIINGCALLLIFVASTARGRLVGGGVFLIGTGLMAALLFWLRKARRRFILVGLGHVAIGVAMFVIACVLTPTGYAVPDSQFVQGYFGQENLDGFRRFALSNIVPERDQFAMGMVLFGLIDPTMQGEKAAELRRALGRVYDEIEGKWI